MKFVLLLPIMILVIILDGLAKNFISSQLTVMQFSIIALVSISLVILIKRNRQDAINVTCLFGLLAFVIF